MDCSVIIPAAGTGQRLGSKIPKQYIELNDVPIIIHTLKIFDRIPEVSSIVIAINPEWRDFLEQRIFRYQIGKISAIVDGGFKRQDSIWNALTNSNARHSDIVLIHDAVRPLTSTQLVRNIIEASEEYGAVVPAIKPKDTIKEINSKGGVKQTFDRNKLCSVQTPQGFWKDILIKSYEKAMDSEIEFTDDASLVELAGYQVQVIDGEETNIKITSPLDLKIAETILNTK